MFCKKCGQEIKEGVRYCPKCGNEAGKALPLISAGSQTDWMKQINTFNHFSQSSKLNQSGQNKEGKSVDKRIVYACVIIGVIVLAGIMIGLLIKGKLHEEEAEEEEKGIVGEWVSDDLVYLEDYMVNILEEQGIPGLAADYIVELMGLDELGELTLTFTNSGGIQIGMDGVSIGVGTFTYEELQEGRLLLKYQFDATILGTGIPVSIAYTSDYTISKNNMKMDLFGCKCSFTRVN